MPDLEDSSIPQRFNHLLAVMHSERFLKMRGLNNEVPFFICPFSPRETLAMDKLCEQLIRTLANQHGIHVLNVNLYDLAIELLKKRNLWTRVLERETALSKDELKELLQGVLDPEHHLIRAIGEKMAQTPFDILFVTGVGEVFPYIRSHTVLNNLQSTAKDRPTVMFFPGKYTHSLEKGASLDLFERLHDDKYYRAFNIYLAHV